MLNSSITLFRTKLKIEILKIEILHIQKGQHPGCTQCEQEGKNKTVFIVYCFIIIFFIKSREARANLLGICNEKCDTIYAVIF